MEKRISKQELQKMYGVTRLTIETWVKNYGLPLIVISSHSKFIRERDLLQWEEQFMKNK
jgi:hypothetical protein